MNMLCVLSDCSRKLTKNFICFPSTEGENTIWCPRCHLRNRWRVIVLERQALWSRRKSLVTNLQCLPDWRVAYNKKASSSELSKTNGKDRCHSWSSKRLQEMNQMLIWDLFISNTENSHHYSSSLVKLKNCLPPGTKRTTQSILPSYHNLIIQQYNLLSPNSAMWNRTAKTHTGTPKTLLEYKQSSQLIIKCNVGNRTDLWIFVFTWVNTHQKVLWLFGKYIQH